MRFIGNGSSNYVTVNQVSVPKSGYYKLTIWATSTTARSFKVSVNSAPALIRTVQTGPPTRRRASL